ncbi:hypothetical protein AB6A40_006777 [Gnathostoma spinigerum]|uniref:Uncharacterized protein n=1 Tax=Gnathostoma spinigerum TaxID=75299 RepID=A0ABD6ESR2_9BILA
MSYWSCAYCTFNNCSSSRLCAACGSENPKCEIGGQYRWRSQSNMLSWLPKISVGKIFDAIDSGLMNLGRLTQTHSNPPVQIVQSNRNPVWSSCSSSATATSGENWSEQGEIPSAWVISSTYQSLALISACSTELLQRDIQSAAALYERVVSFCRSSRTAFLDDGFPQSIKSIGNIQSMHVQSSSVPFSANPNQLVWLRPCQISTKDGQLYAWSVFRNPLSSDIEQGSLGDCWLLSAMVVIAERPDALENIVLTKVFNKFGVYQIRLCVDGLWQVVIVDSFFPCYPVTHALAFAVGRRNQLWVSLLEKAFAKLSGNYSKLLAGRVIEGLAVLTGAPCCRLDLENLDSNESLDLLWVKLLSMKEADFLMGCSCGCGKRNVNDDAFKRMGLLPRHAYSLLDVKEYNSIRLVRLRNPWGVFVWKGDWSDEWSGWDPTARSVLCPNGSEGGTFWMPFRMFVRYFDQIWYSEIDIAKFRCNNGWQELRVPCLIPASWGASSINGVQVRFSESSEVSFTLYYQGRRDMREVDIMLLVHKLNNTGSVVGEYVCRTERIMGAFVCTDDLFLASQHDYLLIPISFSNLHGWKDVQTVVAIHSRQTFSAENVSLSAANIRDALVKLVHAEGTKQEPQRNIVNYNLASGFSGHLVMIDNRRSKKWLHVHCDASQSVNVLSSRGDLITVDSIPPLHRQIILILSHFEPTLAYSVRINTMHRLSSSPSLNDFVALAPGRTVISPEAEHIPSTDDDTTFLLHSPQAL